MTSPRPFRFGAQVADASSGDAWRDMARAIEDLGYSTMLMPDHFGGQLAPVPALTSAAEATTALRVGTLVFDNDYKHPLVLAKECATIDVLSGGRFELGLGAGWMKTDYDQAGMAYDAPGARIDRMVEGFAKTHPNIALSLLDDDHQLIASLPRIWNDVQPFLGLTA